MEETAKMEHLVPEDPKEKLVNPALLSFPPDLLAHKDCRARMELLVPQDQLDP